MPWPVQQFLLAERKFTGAPFALVFQSDKRKQFHRIVIRLRRQRPGPAACRRRRNTHVVNTRHDAINASLLKSSHQSGTSDSRRRQAGNIFAVEANDAGIHRKCPANQVKQSAFAGAVGADNATISPLFTCIVILSLPLCRRIFAQRFHRQ